jgi:hypothetical protein
MGSQRQRSPENFPVYKNPKKLEKARLSSPGSKCVSRNLFPWPMAPALTAPSPGRGRRQDKGAVHSLLIKNNLSAPLEDSYPPASKHSVFQAIWSFM